MAVLLTACSFDDGLAWRRASAPPPTPTTMGFGTPSGSSSTTASTAAPAAMGGSGPAAAPSWPAFEPEVEAWPPTPPSAAVRRTVRVALRRAEAGARPFLVVDKLAARLYVFDAGGRLRGDAPVLLGAARGDASVPGIGDKPLAAVRPAERTTPAGRFRGEAGMNTAGEDIVWLDYDAAVSLHRVRARDPAERRLERLASPEVDDNRISYGCINVPAAFYDAWVGPLFATGPADVHVLPELRRRARR